MTWIDITRSLHNEMVVWPGDTPFAYALSWSMADVSIVNVGQLTMSTHSGTHIDAPFHFDSQGVKVDELDLSLFIGEAKVVCFKQKKYISPVDLESVSLQGVERLLIRTDSWTDPAQFPLNFTYLCPRIGPYLMERGVRLIGLDVPSVDPVDSKTLDAHHSLHKAGIQILEGLQLEGVTTGRYNLIALPLRIEGGDGSPVRAVINKIN